MNKKQALLYLLSISITISLLAGSIVTRNEFVGMQAAVFSADVYNDQPYMAHYLGLIEFTTGVANSLYVAFIIAAVVGAVVKLVAYRRGL